MAHDGVVLAGSWIAREAIGEGIFFQEDADVAGQVEICEANGQPLGIIPVYPSPTDANNPKQDPPHQPPARGQQAGKLVYGHIAGPPSQIIEVKMGADENGTGNIEIVVGANGEAVKLPSGAGRRVIGIVRGPWKDGDIKECQVRPRFTTT